jgi:hypothetical protein
MDIVVRDFNTIDNHKGDITIYLSNNNHICVNILNIHEHGYFDCGQARIYIKYRHDIDIYDTFMTILDKLTHDIFQDLLEIIRKKGNLDPTITVEKLIPTYKDIIPVPEDIHIPLNIKYRNLWGNCIDFTRETVQYLEKIESDNEIYVIKGEIMENGEFIYDKPIRSNNYY